MRKFFIVKVIGTALALALVGLLGLLGFSVWTTYDMVSIRGEINNIKAQNSEIEELVQRLDNYEQQLEETKEFINSTGAIVPWDELRDVSPAISRGEINGDGSLPAIIAARYPGAKALGKGQQSFYTTAKDEGGGLGCTGVPLEPYIHVAVDREHWKIGTLFYIENFGIVQAVDSGSAIKGYLRMDLCVTSKQEAATLGRKNWSVWVLE